MGNVAAGGVACRYRRVEKIQFDRAQFSDHIAARAL
jgi:hypothetical protein